MVQLTELATAGASAVLLGNALLPHPQLWVLFVIAGVMAALDGLQRPSLEAMVPRLVDRDELPAASALGSFRHGVGSVVGPPIGGLLIAGVGLPSTYAVDVVSFSVSLAALAAMRASPPPPEATAVSIRSVVEGVEFAAARPELVGTYVVDIIAMFFGMPMALYPAIAEHLGGAGVLGFLYAAPSAGSLIAAGTSGWIDRVHRHGLAVIFAAAGWGLAIAVFGLVNSLPLALLMLAVAGAADMISGIYRQTIWNQTVPDHLRGRLAGIEMLSYSTGPLLGNVESGVVAALFSVQASVVSGGIACVVGVAAAAFALPGFRKYRADEEATI
jgi:MFS family permease